MRGKLIAFEGIDAVGKNTQTELLLKKLGELRVKTLYLKFPTYEKTLYGQLVRDHLQGKHGEKEKTSPYIAAMLFALDRMQFRDKIIKALKAGIYIVCDRYKASNAFQIAKEPEKNWREFFDWLQRLEAPLPDADATVWIDLPAEKTFLHTRESKDIYEKDLAFQNTVRRAYSWLSDFIPMVHVKGMEGDKHKGKEEIFSEIWRELEGRGVVSFAQQEFE